MQKSKLFAAGLALASGAALADSPKLMREHLAIFERFAGAPVERVLSFRGVDQWKPLGKSAIAIWINHNRVFLLQVEQPCVGLDWTHGIRLTSHHPVIEARFDSIEFGQQKCRIAEIRPVDWENARRELYPRR